LIHENGYWEALILELRSPNYVKVGAKMTTWKGMRWMCLVPLTRDLVIDTLGILNSSPSSKRYSIIPLNTKKSRCRYAIYMGIDTNSYYGNMNDEDCILEKVEQPMDEEIRGRELRK